MTHKYLFDVKLFTTLEITADSRQQAEQNIRRLLDCAEANFGRDEAGDPLVSEVHLDTEDGAELIEIDGEVV